MSDRKQVVFWLEPDIHFQLKVLAAQRLTTMSSLADEALRIYVGDSVEYKEHRLDAPSRK